MSRRPAPAGGTLVLAAALAGCASSSSDSAGLADPALPPGAQAIALDGTPLFPVPIADERRSVLERNLAEARAAYAADPSDADAIVWMGRRLAYLGEFRGAISFFTEGIAKHPYDARFLRHRGHRWITVREFDRAVADLEKAARLVEGRPDEVEPDGRPNPSGVPIGTLHSNIDYHLALAHFLRGEWRDAERIHVRRLAGAENDDRICSSSYWLYLIRHRLGDADGAARVLERISPGMELLENFDYHRLLLLYRGTLPATAFDPEPGSVASATVAYGLAQHRLIAGDREGGLAALRGVLDEPEWAAFGFIAAEADLADPTRLSALPVR